MTLQRILFGSVLFFLLMTTIVRAADVSLDLSEAIEYALRRHRIEG